MKAQILTLGVLLFLAAGCGKTLQSQPTTQSQPTAAQSTPQPTAQSRPTTAQSQPTIDSAKSRSGTFVKAEHETQGTARIISDKGSQFIEFDGAFKTDNGPDLFVILTRQKQPPIGGIREQDYKLIGALQKVSGTQRYAIPPDLKLEEFGSVAIWCRQFNATFGYAQLSP
jgi:hypothetical protein